MSSYEEIAANSALEWPYPVRYGEEKEVSADVLVLGGGIAGSHAAVSAAKKGAKVVVVEKGALIRSGSGGAGVDHWINACTNPCSKVTPEEMTEIIVGGGGFGGGYAFGHTTYIECKEGWDGLLDVEKMGVKIRDTEDEFAGAEFRDEETKLMFAWDYENNFTVRLWGADIKVALYKELKRLGVDIYDRVMATSLLTEDGQPGKRVIGATGVSTRTGEFYIFKAKATILSAAHPSRLWVFSTELQGGAADHSDPNSSGDGHAMAWKAGAEFALMERSIPSAGGFRYPAYGTGNAHNTFHPCTIVDSNGKEIPWVDRDGKVIKTFSERGFPSPGQRLCGHSFGLPSYDVLGPGLIPDLAERIYKGEYVLPFYADFPSIPEHERRAIWGLMVGQEGKTRIIYNTYSKAGFDPDKDMLQVNVLPPEAAGQHSPWWSWYDKAGCPPQWREVGFWNSGGPVVDWDLRTNLEGLYAAGNQLAGGGLHGGAATTGRYAGRKAAAYAGTAGETAIDRKQVEAEKSRVYAPVNCDGDIGWKELYGGITRIMQDYCGEYKGEQTLKMGLRWLNSIRESEAARTCARNPHELWRTLECFSRITAGEIIMHASLARKASCPALGFKRLDYPEIDPPEWNKFVTIRLENGEAKVGELPFNYWLLPPYAPTYEENYKLHAEL